MVVCSKCGAEVSKEDKFCGTCGEKLTGTDKTIVQASDIGRFLQVLSIFLAQSVKQNKAKNEGLVPYFESAIALGLLLAKRQNELPQACTQWWNFTREGSSDEFVDNMIDMYNGFQASQNE